MLRLIRREKGFAMALASAILLLALGPRLLSDLGLDGRTGGLFLWLFGVCVASSFAVVRHAEVLAHRYGEPFGTLILTLSAVCIDNYKSGETNALQGAIHFALFATFVALIFM